MINSFVKKWRSRPQYPTFSEMPDPLLVFFAVSGFLVSGYFGYVLASVVPDFLKVANMTPVAQWGWRGLLSVLLLGGLSVYVWLFGSVALRCNTILRDRWFK